MSQNDELKNEFIQIRLWNNCINKCAFCSLRLRTNSEISIEQKRSRLFKAINIVREQRASKVGLIGGEFFEGQLKGCEEEWLLLLDAIQNVGSEIFISANLIHKQYFLDETIEALNGKLLLCTSYDEVGRFHTQDYKDAWFQRIATLHKRGINLFCTCIPTQEFVSANTKFPEWLGINLCDPHVSVEWLINVDKKHYHEHLLRDNKHFNLPKRKSAIAWMRKHPNIVKNYAAYNETHSNTIYGFDEKDEVILEIEGRLSGAEFNNPNCGHPYFCLCYADSDKCMMCDATAIARQS